MTGNQAAEFFLALVVILILARLLGWAARSIGQPPVLGEILTGILIGPTLFHGVIAQNLLPTEIRPYLSPLASLGLALFMFAIGSELEHSVMRAQGRIAGSVALSSVLLPFALGTALAVYLAGNHQSVHRAGFVIFLGAAMSVTAFPVLARILADRGLLRTRIGGVALACAAVDDLLAWSLLAVAVAATGAGQWHMLLAPVYLAAMWLLVRPALRRLLVMTDQPRAAWVPAVPVPAVVVTGLLLSCWAAEWLGLHFIFGAFLFGAVMPRGLSPQAAAVPDGLRQFGSFLLLPVFFVTAGLKVDLSHLDSRDWGELALILLTAIGGKAAGAYGAARLQGWRNRQALVLATLMNTRGLTELVILTVGLQMGVIDAGLFSLMVVMALVTTFMAGPLLSLLLPPVPKPTVPKPVLEPHHRPDADAAVETSGVAAAPATVGEWW
ncbi:cation:proton antiporter [Streptomyces sp. H10-C2]|uniref:cation:proton antiporter n=1 Tax=unclassified Streptomyces TaxID=2593676 RepID=UPI0024B9602E|nr:MULTISPECIES: cation:proton antiporter [unclassified Streptomyces]MDJ0346012.1 cation:proton antiporter [Streptomyces sp. PH10-H1]MDJ0370481.1 cation:proton antiporter [Streptomyces sp. H10-C2]